MRFYLSLLLLLITAPGASAQVAATDPMRSLAERVVASALLASPGPDRDLVLRTVSRNLRHAYPDLALRSAEAMTDDYERRSFEPEGGPLDVEIMNGVREMRVRQDENFAKCRALMQLAATKPADTSEFARRDDLARACAYFDAPPGIEPPPYPSSDVLILVAQALAPGKTRAKITFMDLWLVGPGRGESESCPC